MSYDLLVFEPEAAPRDRPAFMAWYSDLIEWGGDHDYNDPANTTPRLQAWYREMLTTFFAMNGPDAPGDDFDDELIPRLVDFCIAEQAIYVGFRWSVAEEAYSKVFELAQKHRLGFFDVSAEDGEVWLPAGDDYVVVHGTSGVS